MAWDELTARQVELARRTGALSLLPVALDDRFGVELFCRQRLAAATSLAAEADAVIEATGSHLSPARRASRWPTGAGGTPRRWR